jgi:hypothetical protein
VASGGWETLEEILVCVPDLVDMTLICSSATEVTQQSKVRHKDDFLVAFSPVIAEATATAYKGAPAEVQTKLRRVIDVWKDRNIFEQPIQAAIEARIDGRLLFPLPFAW